jgi:iron complex outermembrane receptor protein
VFYTKYREIQVQRLPPGSTTPILENAGEAHIYGAELESLIQFMPGFNVTISGSYLQAQYDSIAPNITSVTLSTPFALTPEWSGSIGVQYRLPMSSGADVDFNTDYSYRTKQWSTPVIDQLPIGAYGLLNARVTYRSASGIWSVAAFGNNLTDKQYFAGGIDLRPVTGQIRYDVGRPRQFGVEAKVSF